MVQSLLDNAPCGFLTVGKDGETLYANRTLSEWLGFQPRRIGEIFNDSNAIYHEAQIVPMLELQGSVREIACQLAIAGGGTLPVLMNARRHDACDRAPERVDYVFFDATERQRFETSLRQARSEAEELAAIVRGASVGILRVAHDGSLKRWNAAAESLMTGPGDAAKGDAIAGRVPLDGMAGDWFADARDSLEGAAERRFEAVIGTTTHLNITVSRIPNQEDPFDPQDYSVVLRDVTERVRAERRLALMVGELNHRVKNTLTIASSLVNQTLRDPDMAVSRKTLVDRLNGLAASHEVLTENFWENLPFARLLDPLLRQMADRSRITFDGPPILVTPGQFRTLSIAFHELLTNALKYGALSNDTGRIDVSWTLSGPDNDQMTIVWTETDGPEVKPPDSHGFGTTMIEQLFATELGGETETEFLSEGLRFTCRCVYIPPAGNDTASPADG